MTCLSVMCEGSSVIKKRETDKTVLIVQKPNAFVWNSGIWGCYATAKETVVLGFCFVFSWARAHITRDFQGLLHGSLGTGEPQIPKAPLTPLRVSPSPCRDICCCNGPLPGRGAVFLVERCWPVRGEPAAVSAYVASPTKPGTYLCGHPLRGLALLLARPPPSSPRPSPFAPPALPP